jgi:putative Holliday junction resolvase
MNQILALDYGIKRTGIAYAESPLFIAHSLKTVKTHDLLIYIENYLLKNKVVKIVIGEPKSLSGGQTHSSDIIQKFHLKMTKSFPDIEIKFYDERLTSKIAMQTILGSGIKKMKRRNKEALDKIAAVIILQDYLKSEEFQRPSKT